MYKLMYVWISNDKMIRNTCIHFSECSKHMYFLTCLTTQKYAQLTAHLTKQTISKHLGLWLLSGFAKIGFAQSDSFFPRVNILFNPHFFPFMVVWELGFWGWVSGATALCGWGFEACGVQPSGFFFGSLWSSYKHVKINLEIWIALAVSPQAYNILLYT